MVVAEDTAATDEHQAGHEVSQDPSLLDTAVYEAGYTCQCQNLAALHYDALISDTLGLGQLERYIPVHTNNKYTCK